MGLQPANVLTVIQQLRDVPAVFDRLRRLRLTDTPAHAVRVVYAGLADLGSRHVGSVDELKSYVLAAEESSLEDALRPIAAEFPGLESATIWNRRQWEGIVNTAHGCAADLIVKAAHADEQPVFLRAPDDWNLLRHARVPVLMVAPGEWKNRPDIAAAIDVHDRAHAELNRRVLETADSVRGRVEGHLHIVSAVPSVGVLLDNAPLDQDSLRRELDAEARELIDELCTTLGVTNYVPHVVAGEAGPRLGALCEEQGMDLLVLGAKARSGLAGFMLGNTSQSMLAHASVDVLTVPIDAGPA